MDYLFLSNYRPDSADIAKWPFIQINEHIRLFYRVIEDAEPGEEKMGFYFHALQGVAWYSGIGNWEPGQVQVQCIYHGIAYWDELRHLYMGHELTANYGYDYYPSLDDHIAILNALKDLQSKHCRGDQ